MIVAVAGAMQPEGYTHPSGDASRAAAVSSVKARPRSRVSFLPATTSGRERRPWSPTPGLSPGAAQGRLARSPGTRGAPVRAAPEIEALT